MKIYPQIKRSMYHFKQNILQGINPEKCQYILLEKIPKTNIQSFKIALKNIPLGVDTFTISSIGKRDDKTYRKKILTFYSKGNIVERLIEDSDGERIFREYKLVEQGNEKSNTSYRKIIQKRFNPETIGLTPELFEEMKIYKFPQSGKIKLQIKKNEIRNEKIKATVTEYPISGSHLQPKKILGVVMDFWKGVPNITETFETANVKFPIDDKFLPFRFIIDDKLKLKALTRFFIREKGLEKLGINIQITEDFEKNAQGYFSDFENKITYRINPISNFADLSAHEVEHAYQYRQIGRVGKGYSQYGRNSLKYYGKIDGIKENMEAHRYASASENYPVLKDDEDLTKNADYLNNYLEVKAREAGEKAKKEYEDLGKEVNSQFFFWLE